MGCISNTIVGCSILSGLFDHSERNQHPTAKQPIAPSSQDFDGFVSSFRSGIFLGCTICCSNVDSDEKEQLARLITTNGGQYSTSLDKHKCTHLIMGQAGGEKAVVC